MLRVAQALAHGRAMGLDRLDAQLLLAHLIGQQRTWVIAHDDHLLDDDAVRALHALFARRAAGEPLAYLVGQREFCGLMLRVTPDVLVPRPDTETLVEWALECVAPLPTPRLLDLGTGSGAVALAIKRACARAEVHATDSSETALAVARDNGRTLALAVDWHLGRWWDAAPDLPFDVVVSNPPYVAADDPHLTALAHEPRCALTPEGDPGDGLRDIERIINGAASRLARKAWLLLEHGALQAEAVRARLSSSGFSEVTTRCDLAGRPRVSGGCRPG